jgi:hypothetical protein
MCVLGITGANAADQPISEAEKQMFVTNHLKNVQLPSTLRYHFEKSGSLEDGYQDDATMVVEKGNASKGRMVKVNYLTGKNNFKLPDLPDAEGNPIILFYLERELAEMKRLTGGSPNYYRKRIRLALVEEASVKPVTIKYEGKDVKGSEIRISPYTNDPARPRYEKFAEKYYVFTLSDQIPGGVYQMRGVLTDKGAGNGQAPATLLEETLTFTGSSK